MRFATIAGIRGEAQPGLKGLCPSCGASVSARCGRHNMWHWAHKGLRDCDPWWEETEWHRGWKNQFPVDWQEISLTGESGEKHRADVKTPSGLVIEFQHSPLSIQQRKEREAFYKNMVWVVDVRGKRKSQQLKWSVGPCVRSDPPPAIYVSHLGGSALLDDWDDSPFPVYFDLGAPQADGAPDFWRRDHIARNGRKHWTHVSRDSFLKMHREGPANVIQEDLLSDRIGKVVERARIAAAQPWFPAPGARQVGRRR